MKELWPRMTTIERDTAVYMDRLNGMSVSDISRKFEISESKVRSILKYEKEQYKKAVEDHKDHVQEIKEYRSRYPAVAEVYPIKEEYIIKGKDE